LDNLLIKNVSESIGQRLAGTSTLSQIAQIVTNLEHFQVACTELERSLTSLRSVSLSSSTLYQPDISRSSAQRGGIIRLSASSSFSATLSRALERLIGLITSKLDDFFGLAEYDWTPKSREEAPSMYLYELINWLTTVVDELAVKDGYKDKAYMGAVAYIAECFMVNAIDSIQSHCRLTAKSLKGLSNGTRHPDHERKRHLQCSCRRWLLGIRVESYRQTSSRLILCRVARRMFIQASFFFFWIVDHDRA
jgi:hypothetical protein